MSRSLSDHNKKNRCERDADVAQRLGGWDREPDWAGAPRVVVQRVRFALETWLVLCPLRMRVQKRSVGRREEEQRGGKRRGDVDWVRVLR